jgi:lysophospholipase L1-like esterase
MARLPQPGGDAGNWGDILNEYLSQSHADDGNLRPESVGAPQLKQNSVTSGAISDGAVTPVKLSALGTANGVASLDGNAKLPESQVPSRLESVNLNNAIGSIVEAAIANLANTSVRLGVVGYRNNRLGAVGDSITSFDGSSPVIGTGGGAYHAMATAASQGRVTWAGARGVGGNTVEQIVDERIPDFIAAGFNAGACVVLAGTNSVTGVSLLSGQARTNRLTELLTKLNSGYDALLSAGTRPVAATIPVRSNAAATEAAGLEWNAVIRANAIVRGLDLVDFYAVTAASQGIWKANYNLPGDDVHPSPLGHKWMGQALVEVLYPRMVPRSLALATTAADPDDLLAGKGLFATDVLSNAQNTPGDGITDSWQSFSGTGVIFTRTQDAFGIWWQRITVPASASGGGLLQVNLNGSVAIGDRVRIAGRIRTNGFDLLAPSGSGPAATFNAVVRGSAGNVAAVGSPSTRADFVREGVIDQEITIPSGANGNLQVNLQVGRPPVGAADVWAEFAQVVCTNKTARKLLS